MTIKCSMPMTLAGNLTLARHISLIATEKTRLNNGPLECRLLKFEINSG